MKKILLPLLLITSNLIAQTPCATEPCTFYVKNGQCCTGQLKVVNYAGNQCIEGEPGNNVLDSATFSLFGFLSFRNLIVKSTVNFTTGDKTLYTNGDVTIDTLLINGGDVINKLGGSLTINNPIFTGTGNVTLWLKAGESVTIDGTTYVDGQDYTNSFGSTAKILVRTCVVRTLALRPVTSAGQQWSPSIKYRFTVVDFTGRTYKWECTYTALIQNLKEILSRQVTTGLYTFSVTGGGKSDKITLVR